MRAASPSSATQPQWSSSAAASAAKTNTANASATAVTPVVGDVLKSGGVASRHIDLGPLAQPGVDVRRWINVVLNQLQRGEEAERKTSHTTSANTESTSSNTKKGGSGSAEAGSGPELRGRDTASVTEQITNALYDRVQQHAHEVGSEVEELIAQTIVRLPRTTLELNRMRADTKDVAAQLSAIEAAVQPARSTDENKNNNDEDDNKEDEESSAEQAARLNTLKQAQTKLQRCSTTLDRAMRVDAKLHAIEEATQRLRRGQDTTSTTTTSEPIDAIAAAVREVQRDLAALREVESNYGERQQATLRRCEEVIESALERQCLSYLLLHHEEQAARLFHTLHSIGRAEAVLQNYASHVVEEAAQRISRALRALQPAREDTSDIMQPGKGSAGHEMESKATLGQRALQGNAAATNTADKTVAEVLWRELVPLVSKVLSEELSFLLGLIARIRSEVAADASRKDAGDETHTSNSVQDVASMEAMVRQVMQNMIQLLSESFEHGMMAIVQHDVQVSARSNRELVDWYDAVRHLCISTTVTTTSAVGGSSKSENADIAAQLSERAIEAFGRVFRAPATLQAFCTRAIQDIEAHVAQCLPGGSASTGNSGGSSGGSSAVVVLAVASDPYTALGNALLARVKEVLQYFPGETLGRCVTGWQAALMRLIDPLRPAAAQAAVSKSNSSTENNATPKPTQAELLRRLFLATRRVRPGLLRCQKQIDAFLSTTSSTSEGDHAEERQEQAGRVQATLHERLWLPLYSSIESVAAATQEAIQAAMLQPLYAKTALYTALPYWHSMPTSPIAITSSSTGNEVMSPLAPYNAGHSAPSQPVREVGEAIIEIPLLLDTLRVESGAAAHDTGKDAAQPSLSITREEMNALIEEMAESWLETIVHGVIQDFVQEKVLRLRIDFAATQPPEEALRRVAGALEQVDTDLSYLKNILSAVSEERVPLLEDVLTAVHTLPARSESSAFVLGDVLHLA